MSVKERYIVGVDLGGTNIVAGAMPLDGSREIAMHTTQTLAEGGAASVVDRIAGMIEQVITQTMSETGAKRSDFLGVGIGSPGPLNREKGIVIVTPNLGWKNFPLRDEISSRVHLEATLDNDANCATLGEFWCGAAQGGRNVIGMTLGTGIGGGIVIDGRIYGGAAGTAGEVGHVVIDPDGRQCSCGARGCLEAMASGLPTVSCYAVGVVDCLRDGENGLLTRPGDVPALAAGVLHAGSPPQVAVVGVRKRGSDRRATADDPWHLGSNTKPFTALLIALLIDQGRLDWDTPLAQIFPEQAGIWSADLKKFTPAQLLTHTSGLPPAG